MAAQARERILATFPPGHPCSNFGVTPVEFAPAEHFVPRGNRRAALLMSTKSRYNCPSSGTLPRMRRTFIIFVCLSAPVIAEAKRQAGYAPPPYAARFSYALLGLSIVCAPILTLSAVKISLSRTEQYNLKVYVLASISVVAIGAAVAALDGQNDEGWNPALFGTPFVAASFPLALYVSISRDSAKRGTVVAGAAVIAILATLPLMVVTGEVLQRLKNRGWPVAW